MAEFHERLKAPIPRRELDRRTAALQEAMKKAGLDCIITQNITQFFGACNRWLTDTTAEINYPQSSILPAEGEVRYIACSGPPQGEYPPFHLLRIGKPYDFAPYFAPFNYTHDWEGQFAVRWLTENNAKRVGIAGFEMFYWNYYDYISKHLPDVELVEASSLFDEIRAVKSEDEQVIIREAAKLQDKAMGYVISMAQPGVTEAQIRARLCQIVTDHGGEKMIITTGSAPMGQPFALMSSFYQNKPLEKGDLLYVRMSTSGPGGMYTTIGRLFAVGCEPSEAVQAEWEKALAAQKFITDRLVPGGDPQTLFADYNKYLSDAGYQTEDGLFVYSQGYDNVERPSVQPGETLPFGLDMNMAVHTKLVNEQSSVYCADSFFITPDGPQRLHKTPQVIFRT